MTATFFNTVLVRSSLFLLTAFVLSSCDFGSRNDIPQDGQGAFDNQPTSTETVHGDDYTVSGPYSHENLSVFLVHGNEALKADNILTLQNAMDQKKIVVHETGSVNTLAVENVSNEEIFIQAGEIVKGGQQDRVLAIDMILASNSGKVAIDAFCVEQGRWEQRGDEQTLAFSSSDYFISDKEIKLAAKGSRSQNEVWENVEEAQTKLSRKLDKDVKSKESKTSLQLSLEDSAVQGNAAAYVDALKSITEGKNDVIGYVFAINGTLNSADIYASKSLFKKLWPKLLHATAVEALAEFNSENETANSTAAVKATDVQSFLTDAGTGKAEGRQINKLNKLLTNETDDYVMFETRVGDGGNAWIHKNYIVK